MYLLYRLAEQAKSSALLQLVDILQTLPEVYMLMVFGGDRIRARMRSVRQLVKLPDPTMSTLQTYPDIWMKLRSLLICHAAGLRLVSKYTQEVHAGWHPNAQQFIEQTGICDLHEVELFVSFLT